MLQFREPATVGVRIKERPEFHPSDGDVTRDTRPGGLSTRERAKESCSVLIRVDRVRVPAGRRECLRYPELCERQQTLRLSSLGVDGEHRTIHCARFLV